MDFLSILTHALSETDPEILMNLLEICYNILKLGQTYQNEISKYAELFESTGCLERLEALQNHINVNIYQCATSLIDEFFGVSPMNSEFTH